MSPLTFDLEQLLVAWKTRLQEWSADGSLVAAAREALLLNDVPQELKRLAGQWALGDFSGLPPIEVLEGTELPGAAGAYAVSTGTIYLNRDWLASASDDWLIQVLTEELGHHLDGLLNAKDTPGDEGELMALLIDHAGHQPIDSTNYLATEDDSKRINLPSGQVTLVEQSSLPGSTFSIGRYSGNNKFSDGPEGIKLWFFINRSGSISGSRSLNVATASGTATSGVDYIPLNTTVHFAPGETSKEIYVETLEDLAQEGNERFTVNISRTSTSDSIANPSSYGEIRNLQFVNQNPVPRHPSLAANYGLSRLGGPNGNSWGVEGSNLWFRIYRYGNTSSSGAVRFFTTDGTARAGLDFKGSDSRVDFAAGQAYRDVYIETFSDAISEGDERFFVNIMKYYDVDRIANPTVFGEIYNQPGSVVQPTTYSIRRISNVDGKNSDGTEGSSLWFRVTRAGNVVSSGAVNFSTSSGTARSGFDFIALNGRLNFAPGETTKDVSIATTKDLLSEAAERFTVSITRANSGDIIGNASTYGEILNASPIQPVDSVDLGELSQRLRYSNLALQSGERKRFRFRLPSKVEQSDQFSVESYGLHFRRSDGSTSGFTLYDSNGAVIPSSEWERVPAGSTVTIEVSDSNGASFNGSFDVFLWKVNGTVYNNFIGQAKEVSIKKYSRDSFSEDFSDTWVVSHGWNGTVASDSSLYKLASEIKQQNGEPILVDWGSPANHPGNQLTEPQKAASWINDVASFSTHALVNVWGYRSNLNLVGHSLGAYLSSEIARLVSEQAATKNYKVERLIALDPAEWVSEPYNISNRRTGNPASIVATFENRYAKPFSEVSQYSLAFWGAWQVGDGAGSGITAKGANDSFQVYFDENNNEANHGYFVDLYRNLIDGDPQQSLETFHSIRGYFPLRQKGNPAFSGSDITRFKEFYRVGSSGALLSSTYMYLPRAIVNKLETFQRDLRAINSYLSGGTVHLDLNKNLQFDAFEPLAVVTSSGQIQLSLDGDNGLISSLGSDIPLIYSPSSSTVSTSTGLTPESHLSAPLGSSVITPLTTLLVELNRSGFSLDQAIQVVNQALDIPFDILVTHYDPLAAVGQGDLNAKSVYVKSAAIQNTVTQITSLLKAPSGLAAGPLSFKIFASIAARLSTESIDLTQVDVILEIIAGTVSNASIILSPELIGLLPDVAAVIADGQLRLASITESDPYLYLDEVARIQQVSQGKVAAALSRLYENPSDSGWNSAHYSGLELDQLIASAQLLNLLPPTVSSSIFSLQEVPYNQPTENSVGTLVGTIEAFDPEGQPLSFGIVVDPSRFTIFDLDGDGTNAFSIDPATGEIVVADPDDLDYENQSGFFMLVTASDGLLLASAPLTINLTDVEDQPVPVANVNDGSASFALLGEPAVGQDLTLELVWDDPDSGSLGFIREWQSSFDGLTWDVIERNVSTFTITPFEEGKQIRVAISCIDGQGFSESVFSIPLLIPFIDDGDADISITGTPSVGQTLLAIPTADDPDGFGSFFYDWQSSANGTDWSSIGANDSFYALSVSEEGKQVRVLVTYTDGQGFSEAIFTDAVLVPFVDEADAVFSINGTPEVGSNLTASLSTADPDGNGVFSYQWQASSDGDTWQPVGTGAATYQLTSAEQGKQVRVLVAYTDGEGFTEQVQTSPVAVPFVNDGAAVFSISGTRAVGEILTASRTADDPDGNGLFSYQWEASSDGSTWQPVGTDATTYQLTAAEQGKQVRVLVSYSDGQGFSEAVTTPLVTIPQSSRTPTITAVVDNLGLVSGVVAREGTTNDRTPTINGTLSVPLVRGESLRMFNGTTLLGNAKVNNAAGTWSYTPMLPITSGSNYAIVARVSDATGNLGAASLSFDFVLDTTAPGTTASITRLADDVGWIQGTVRSGGHTDDATPTMSGLLSAPLEAGESLLIFNGTSLLGQATVNNSELTWSFVPNLPASAGTSYSIVARVSDAAGNLSTASSSYRFRLDTAVPTTTASITGLSDNDGLVNGNVAPGDTTNDRTPAISGSLSAPLASGETLRIFADGTLVGTARVNNSTRTWSYTPTLPATSGTSYSITARVVDAAGNLGATSEARTFTLDSTAPATTVAITAVTDDVGLIQGGVLSRRSTDDLTPTLSGTLSAPLAEGELLHVFRGSTRVGSASVDNNAQTWTFTPTLASTAGTSYTFTARVADAVGNLGPVSNTRSFILDTTAPVTTATIDAVADNFGLVQGSISPGGVSDDRSPTFTGTLSGPLASGETLRIFNGPTLLGSATVNNTARTWSFTPSLPATSGTPYAITASVADAAGNLGPASDAFSFTLDTTPNPITGTTNDDLLTLTRAADLVTGLEGSDTIVMPRLTDSLLGTATAPTFDHITDLITGVDRIDAPVARTLATAANPVVLGAVTDLTSTGIAALLSSAVFPALTTTSSGGAVTFTFNDPLAGTRTFLAINNRTAGFSASTDAIVEITGFSGTLSQLQVF